MSIVDELGSRVAAKPIPAVGSLIDRALAFADDKKRREAEDAEAEAAAIREKYIAVLLRADNPSPGDLEWLSSYMADPAVGHDRRTIERDLSAVTEARALLPLRDDLESRKQKHATAQAARAVFDREWLAKRKPFIQAAEAAREELRVATVAAEQLAELKKAKPHLFEVGDPPRLRVPANEI